MIKKLLIILILFLAPSVYADTGYVSPETYAVNEADLLDYMENGGLISATNAKNLIMEKNTR